MAKPIFVIQIPLQVPVEMALDMSKLLTEQIPDWHVLVIRCMPANETKFNVFSETGEDKVQFEKLKQMLLNKFE